MSADAELSIFLRDARWAHGLRPQELLLVQQSLVDRCFDAGAIVTMKGAPADHWIGVVSGMVKVDTMEVDGRTTTFIGVSKGGWLGEGSVLKDEPRPYEIVALQESRIAFMPRSTFLWLYENSLPFNHFLIAQLNARLGQFISLVEKARMAETPAQVAFGLASLLNPLLNPAADCKVRISQEELGKLCGLSRQIVSGALRRLQIAGVVSLEYGGVRVLDVPALNRSAGIIPPASEAGARPNLSTLDS